MRTREKVDVEWFLQVISFIHALHRPSLSFYCSGFQRVVLGPAAPEILGMEPTTHLNKPSRWLQ